MTDEQTFADYRSRLNIKDVLEDAGYTFYKRDGLRYGKLVRDENVQKKQRRIDAQHSGKSLKDSDNDRLTPDVRDVFQPKFITDRKRDKAKSNLGNQGHEIDCFHADEAKPVYAQGA